MSATITFIYGEVVVGFPKRLLQATASKAMATAPEKQGAQVP